MKQHHFSYITNDLPTNLGGAVARLAAPCLSCATNEKSIYNYKTQTQKQQIYLFSGQ